MRACSAAMNIKLLAVNGIVSAFEVDSCSNHEVCETERERTS